MSRTYRTIIDTYCPCCESFKCEGPSIFEGGGYHNKVMRKRKVRDKDIKKWLFQSPPKSYKKMRERQYRARVKEAMREGRMPPAYVHDHMWYWL